MNSNQNINSAQKLGTWKFAVQFLKYSSLNIDTRVISLTGTQVTTKRKEKPTNCGFKAKRNGLKTWNVHKSETDPRLRVNKFLLRLPPFSRYLMTTLAAKVVCPVIASGD